MIDLPWIEAVAGFAPWILPLQHPALLRIKGHWGKGPGQKNPLWGLKWLMQMCSLPLAGENCLQPALFCLLTLYWFRKCPRLSCVGVLAALLHWILNLKASCRAFLWGGFTQSFTMWKAVLFGDLKPVSDHSCTGINLEQALSAFLAVHVELSSLEPVTFCAQYNQVCLSQTGASLS